MLIGEEGSPWRARRVLVTGAGGFIGSHLVEFLVARGAEVRAFVRYNSRGDRGMLDRLGYPLPEAVEVFPGDIVNPEAVADAMVGCDTVLNLCALIPIPYSYRHPREFVDVNVVGAMNVLEAARRSDVSRLVQVSSSEVYGTAQTVPISEEHPLHPQSPYAATKVAADQLALSYVRSFAVPVVIARPFNTFGPRQSARAVIPTIITQALTRDHIELGALEPTRDFLYVSDTVAGIARCALAEGVEGEVFNLGTGREIAVGDVVHQVLAATGKNMRVELAGERVRPRGSEVERLCASIAKAEERLDWRPTVTFDDGLRRTVDWIAAAAQDYKPTIYNV